MLKAKKDKQPMKPGWATAKKGAKTAKSGTATLHKGKFAS